jgi:hypothetical protein
MSDWAMTVVFVGYLLSKYALSVLIRRLRDQHQRLWSELGQPRVWQLLVTAAGNWRVIGFIWSGDAAETGDDEVITCVWAIRVLTLIVLATTVFVVAMTFRR